MIDPTEIDFVGHGLKRPECALAHSSGTIFCPDWTDDGGVTAILPDGRVKRHLARNWQSVSEAHGFDEPLRPNGICLTETGSFLLAHLGAEKGGIFELLPSGEVVPFLLEIDGVALPPSNFVIRDGDDRTWLTVSTRQAPRAKAYRSDVADGFVAVVDKNGPRIVADDLGYTNECVPHPDGKRLFVNETFVRRLTSFDIQQDGSLTNRKTVAEFGPGTFPDGLAFDCEGNAWITSIVSNRVLKVDNSGEISVYLQDVTQEHLDWVEEAWNTHSMGRPHLDTAAGKVLRNVSNLAFCGSDLSQGVLGCLLGEGLGVIDMPVRGDPPLHWTYDITSLIKTIEKLPDITENS